MWNIQGIYDTIASVNVKKKEGMDMLGYVVAYRPEMKVREAELYKAYYCGVCKSIGRRYGQIPRMVLSYDAAFLAVVLDCLDDEGENLSREGCIINPVKKKAIAYSDAIDLQLMSC